MSVGPVDTPLRCAHGWMRVSDTCLAPGVVVSVSRGTCGCVGVMFVCAGHKDGCPAGATWPGTCPIHRAAVEVTFEPLRPINEGDLSDYPHRTIVGRHNGYEIVVGW